MPSTATTRALFATAAARNWDVHHLDVRTAYLHASMDMDVYIAVPDGFEDASHDALLQKGQEGSKPANAGTDRGLLDGFGRKITRS